MDISTFKISTRLNAGFGAVMVGAILIALVSSLNINRTSVVTDHMVNQSFVKERLISEWFNATNLNGTRVIAIQHISDPAVKQIFEKKVSETSNRISEIQKQLEAMPKNADEKVKYEEIAVKRKEYLAARNDFFAAKKSDKAEIIPASEARLEVALSAYLVSINELVKIQTADIKLNETKVKDEFFDAQLILGLLSFIIIILSVGFAQVIKNSILRPLRQAIMVTKNVTLGNMNMQFQINGNNELSELLWGLKNMTDSLVVLVEKVRVGAEVIASKSSQMASGSLDLSNRTEEQASSLEETASTMEELTSAVKQNSDHAREATQLATFASEVATQGGLVVSQAVNTMEMINASSNKIADITSVIDGIAFQTNILALNAAVEAARAGEQGRGFAVVASEVRNLAQRSAAAAKEIKELIDDSTLKVDAGSKQVHQAGTTMQEIVSSVKKVSEIVGEISNASMEQTVGIEQISNAINQLDEMTQQNANLVEESLASIQSLEEQATQLFGIVNNMK